MMTLLLPYRDLDRPITYTHLPPHVTKERLQIQDRAVRGAG